MIGAVGATAVSRAAFVGAGDNPANSFQAASVTTPTGLSATPGCGLLLTGSYVELSWDAVSGAGSYEVWRSLDATTGFDLWASTSDTYLVQSTENGVTYHYAVRAVASPWSSELSASVSATPDCLL